MDARAAIEQLPRLLDTYHAQGEAQLASIRDAILRMKEARDRIGNAEARAAINRAISAHAARLAKLEASRTGIEKKRVEYAADISRLREAERVLSGIDGGLGVVPLVVGGAVAGLAAFGSWVYSNIKASGVAQQQAENDAQKIELVEQGKLPASALSTTAVSAGPEGLGNVLKWGAVLVGVFLAFQVFKAGRETFAR